MLQQYQRIAALSGQMRAQAEAGQWDAVTRLGLQYAEAVNSLRAFRPLGNTERAARRDLLTQILADDARVRVLAAPELDRLQRLLSLTQRQRTVLQAYCKSTK